MVLPKVRKEMGSTIMNLMNRNALPDNGFGRMAPCSDGQRDYFPANCNRRSRYDVAAIWAQLRPIPSLVTWLCQCKHDVPLVLVIITFVTVCHACIREVFHFRGSHKSNCSNRGNVCSRRARNSMTIVASKTTIYEEEIGLVDLRRNHVCDGVFSSSVHRTKDDSAHERSVEVSKQLCTLYDLLKGRVREFCLIT